MKIWRLWPKLSYKILQNPLSMIIWVWKFINFQLETFRFPQKPPHQYLVTFSWEWFWLSTFLTWILRIPRFHFLCTDELGCPIPLPFLVIFQIAGFWKRNLSKIEKIIYVRKCWFRATELDKTEHFFHCAEN